MSWYREVRQDANVGKKGFIIKQAGRILKRRPNCGQNKQKSGDRQTTISELNPKKQKPGNRVGSKNLSNLALSAISKYKIAWQSQT